MIIVKLRGGLGNQMFQYAFGRFLSIKNKTPLYLDKSFYKTSNPDITKRDYELENLNIPVNSLFNELKIRLFALKPKKDVSFYEKKIGHARQEYIDTTFKNIIIDGYWQSEKYFMPIKGILQQELTPKKEINPRARNILESIQQNNAVAVHIRRGDYVNDEKTRRIHFTCGLDYFNNAISIINGHMIAPVYFIFSDDIAWCKEHLNYLPKKVFVENNKNVEDLFLMSHCKHNIISNSSFSWWGAWLNKHNNKYVIAPRKWTNNLVGTSDLLPNNWIKI